MDERNSVDYKALGAKIQQQRKQLGLAQATVAEKLDLSESFYGRVERGERVLSVETLVKVANFFDMSLDFLLLDSVQGGITDKLQIELSNIFKDKNPSEAALLLNLLKIHSENMERLLP